MNATKRLPIATWTGRSRAVVTLAILVLFLSVSTHVRGQELPVKADSGPAKIFQPSKNADVFPKPPTNAVLPIAIPGTESVKGVNAGNLFKADRPEFTRAIAPASSTALPKAAVEITPEMLNQIVLDPAIERAALAQTHLTYASDAYANQDWTTVLREATLAIEADPSCPSAIEYRAIAYKNLKLNRRAINDFAEVIRRFPDAADTYYHRGFLLTMEGKYDEGLASIQRGFELSRTDEEKAQYYLLRGSALANHGEIEHALVDLDEAARFDPKNPDVDCCRGDCLAKLRRFDQAIEAYSRSLSLSEDLDVVSKRGIVSLLKGDFTKAVEDFDRVLNSTPEHKESILGRGIALLMMGRVKQAEAAIDRAIEVDSRFPLAYAARGWARLATGEPGQALENFNHAINKQQPLGWNVSLGTGGTCIEDPKYDHSIGEFTQAFGEHPGPPWCLIVRKGEAARSEHLPEAKLVVYLIHRPSGERKNLPDCIIGLSVTRNLERGTAFAHWGRAIAHARRSEWRLALEDVRDASLDLIDTRVYGSSRTKPGPLPD